MGSVLKYAGLGAMVIGAIVGPLVFLNLYPGQGAGVFASMALCGLPFAAGFVVLSRRRPRAALG